MIKVILLLIFSSLLTGRIHAQYYTNQNKIWAFGYHAGVDFATGSPVAFSTNINTTEGSASVCNTSGSLLFYTDGKYVYNRSHSLMPNGNSVVSFSTSSTSQTLIVPVIGNANQYYVFSIQPASSVAPLVYCIVDMTLDGGNGDVVSSSIGRTLHTGLSEKIIAIPGNACNVWLLTHKVNSGVFWAYNITLAGIDTARVVSTTGTFTGGSLTYCTGVMKVSPNRQKIVVQAWEAPGTELFDFDPNTGVVSNCQVLSTTGVQYGAEFSPDNTKLYTQVHSSSIVQYDITLTSTSAIVASKTTVASGAFTCDLKLGPDNRIYFGSTGSGALDCFATPNGAGSGCGYSSNAVTLSTSTYHTLGLPNVIISVSPNDTFLTRHDTIACLPVGGNVTLAAHDSGAVGCGYIWSDGTTTTRTKTVTSAGSYWVKIYNGCRLIIDTIHLTTHPVVGPIAGTMRLCSGAATTLSDTTAGGVWTSSSPAVATVGTGTGIVTAIMAGTSTITYTSGTGCFETRILTVDPLPAAITGAATVCVGATTTLGNASAGGTWSSGSPGVAAIGSGTGVVTGVTVGTSAIAYTLPTGCMITSSVTVNPIPAVITGTLNVCVGTSATLSTTGTGGAWSSSNPGIATTGSITGIVTGLASGTSVISYTLPGGCYSTATVTVNPIPGAIAGSFNICAGTSTTLYSTAGGVWSSSAPAVADIGLGTGIVAGLVVGTATITYALPTGCQRTASFTVDPLPAAITGTLSLCVGTTSLLSNATPGGAWSSSDLSVAFVDVGTGLVTGIGTGLAIISYTLLSGCEITDIVAVNPFPTVISGAAAVCVGGNATLYNGIAGGAWSSSNPAIGIINSVTGVYTGITAGSATMTYSMGAGCNATFPVTVYPLPLPVTGTAQVCPAMTTTLYDATPGGVWSSLSPGIASVGSGTGIVTGVSPGTAIIRYSFGTIVSCSVTRTVTVNSLPGAITGTPRACPGATTTLSSAGGGTWLITGSSIATIGSGTGIVTGAAVGTAVVTYTLPTGCSGTTTITVNPLPAPITGPGNLCAATSVTLSTATPGGAWSRSNTSIAIGISSGIVTGISTGTSVVTYTLPTGCYVTKTITVNSSPGAITGTLQVCPANTTTLSNPLPGGTWTPASPAIAIVGSTTGVVTGMAAGTAVVTYSIGTGCMATAIVTVNALPALFTVTGGGGYCAGGTGRHVGLAGSATGISYQLYAGPAAEGMPLGGTGAPLDFGILNTGGIYTVVATSGPGCTSAMTGSVAIIVNPLPAPISGPSAVCAGANITLTNTGGGTWQSSTPASATIGSATGVVTGVAIGTTTITYTLPTGCAITTTVTVSTTPTAIIGASTVCAGATTTLTDAVSGGAWSTLSPAVTIGSLSGIVTGVTAGAATVTYSLGTGCTVTKTMTVLPSPVAIGGLTQLCVGATAVLSSTTGGGTWSSGSLGVATVSGTGVVSGVSAGTAVISYTAGGCSSTKVMTVNAVPTAITGPGAVCMGATLGGLSVTPGGGVWSTTATTLTIGSTDGMVTGVSAGTGVITYSLGTGLTACSVTRTISVNAAPVISGASGVCVGSTSAWSVGAWSGVWASGAGGIGSVSSSGVVTGIAAGVATITFTPATGCIALKTITVNTAPGAITGTAQVCAGGSTVLGNSAGGGVWTSGSVSVATIGSLSGVVNGIAPGVATITYSLGSGCTVTKMTTVNPLPAAITGGAFVCIGSSTGLSNPSPGGAWSSATTAIATVSTAGIVTGIATGTASISYTLTTGCAATKAVTVNALPGSISGAGRVCDGSTTSLSSTGSGVWSSSNPSIASIGSGTGIVTGVYAGTATITFSHGPGCEVTRTMTVDPLPGGITGTTNICIASSTTLTVTSGGGVWSSGAMGIATIGASSGIVTGVSGGTATISYTVTTTGCASTYNITVITVPALTGLTNLCAWGDTVTVYNSNPAGTYSSSLVTVLNLGGGAGMVTAFAPGTGYITYTLAGVGCARTTAVTVNTLPGLIAGTTNLCVGSAATLSNSVGGGVWSSGVTGVATIGSSSGLLTGIGAGSTNIRYTIPNGCKVDTVAYVSVFPVAGTITGAGDICVAGSASLTVTSSGGVWTSGATGIAGVSVSGIVTGVSAGTAAISYAVTNVCGTASATWTMTINPIPDAGVITGTDSLCVGSLTTLSNIVAGGVWSTVNGNAVISATGLVTGVAAGLDTVVYTVTSAAGCVSSAEYVVKVKPWGLCGALVVRQAHDDKVLIWPNPARDELHVENAVGCEVRIFNMLGQEVLFFDRLSITNKVSILKIDRLTPGVYVVEVVGDFGKESRRLVVGR